jgi:serine/threonine-protein kinase
VISFFAFLLLLDLVIMPLYVKKGEIGTVPKVVGKQIDEAMKVVEDAGFEPVNYEIQFDEKAKEGTILRQTPEGGDEAKPGRKVYLIVSAGKEVVKVPSLVGLNLSDARIMLVRSNLAIGKTDYIFADSTPSGVVYRQDPKPGTSLMASKMVNLTVSQGPRTGRVAVPELTGLKLEEAILRITRLGLKPGVPNFNSRPEGAVGSVYDTYPNAGELVEFGSTIELFVVKDNEAPAEEIPTEGQ